MSLPDFAKWAQMIISGFSGLMLCMFWFHVRNLERKGKDRGFLYLGAGLLVWALLYALELTFPLEEGRSLSGTILLDGDADAVQQAPAMFDRFLRRILSVTNSCLFLLTLPFFEHGFERLHQRMRYFHDPAKWGRAVLPAAALTLALTFVTYRIFDAPDQEWIAGLPDGIFSLVAILGLGYAMFISFSKRQLPSMSALTALVLLGLLGVQVLDFFDAAQLTTSQDAEQVFLLLRMCSHSLLAMLFFALAFTWVIERLGPQRVGGHEQMSAPESTTMGAESNPVGMTSQMDSNGNQKSKVKEEPAKASQKEKAPGRLIVFGKNQAGKYYTEVSWPKYNLVEQRIFLSEGKFKYIVLAAVRKLNGEFVHGDKDVRYLYGGNIDTSNSAIKDAFNKELAPNSGIRDRGELMESKGQGSRQYRLRFAKEEIVFKRDELAGDPATQEILREL